MEQQILPEQDSGDNSVNTAAGKTRSYPGIAQSFGLLLLLIAVSLVVYLPVMLLQGYLPESLTRQPWFESAAHLVSYVLSFLITILIAGSNKRKAGGAGFSFTRARRIGIPDMVVLALITPAFAIALDPVYSFVSAHDPVSELFMEEFKKMVQPNILSFVSMAIAPAILEEILMRGIILDGMLKRYKPAKAILMSALIFGIMHLNPSQLVAGFLIGAFIGWVYWRTRSLLACMVIHAVNNGLSSFAALYYGWDATAYDLMGLPAYLAAVVGSYLFFVAGIWWLSKRFSRQEAAVQEDEHGSRLPG